MWAVPCGIAAIGLGVWFARALRRAAQLQDAVLAELDSPASLSWTDADEAHFAQYVAQLRRG